MKRKELLKLVDRANNGELIEIAVRVSGLRGDLPHAQRAVLIGYSDEVITERIEWRQLYMSQRDHKGVLYAICDRYGDNDWRPESGPLRSCMLWSDFEKLAEEARIRLDTVSRAKERRLEDASKLQERLRAYLPSAASVSVNTDGKATCDARALLELLSKLTMEQEAP